MKLSSLLFLILMLVACNRHRTGKSIANLPKCIEEKIASLKKMNETPIYIKRYEYNGEMVYYMKSACCDKFNVVYDSHCNVLGHPDGGLTGKGDGSLPDFRALAKNGIEVWRISEQ